MMQAFEMSPARLEKMRRDLGLRHVSGDDWEIVRRDPITRKTTIIPLKDKRFAAWQSWEDGSWTWTPA